MPHKIIPGSFADWANYSLGSNNGTYPKPTVGPDYEALDEARTKAMDRFLRDYDDYCARVPEQFILNLETDNDA
mgnify:CR=1 FL=1